MGPGDEDLPDGYDFDDFRPEGAAVDESREAVVWLEEEHEAHPDSLGVAVHQTRRFGVLPFN